MVPLIKLGHVRSHVTNGHQTPRAPYSWFHSSNLDKVPGGTLFRIRRRDSTKSE